MSGSVEETALPLSPAAIIARISSVDMATAMGVLAAVMQSISPSNPAGEQIAVALTNAEVARVIRLPNPARFYNDTFRTR